MSSRRHVTWMRVFISPTAAAAAAATAAVRDFMNPGRRHILGGTVLIGVVQVI